jgi:putative chitinase
MVVPMFDLKVFWDTLRPSIIEFPTARQVHGTEVILATWEQQKTSNDLRWLAYMLATTYHETAGTMEPIEEYGQGAGSSYGLTDPETDQTYYGRGYVQLTWRDNYARVDKECGFEGEESCEWNADNALDPDVAAEVMFRGMADGWFRSEGGTPNNLEKYFNDTRDDPFEAREIINGDKNTVPSWSNGQSIGNLIVKYHKAYLDALEASFE